MQTDGIAVINHSSTAPSLAVPDYTFRLVPDDTDQVKILEENGIDVLIPAWRDDMWGNGPESQLRVMYAERGTADDRV